MAYIEKDIGSLISEFSALVKIKAYKFKPEGFEYDDLIQEGYIALFSAVGSFNTGKGAEFKTYADKCIENRMLSFIRHHKALKNSPMNNYTSIEDSIAVLPDPSYSVEEKESAAILLEKINGCLSEKERNVFRLYLQGKTPGEIAALTGTDCKGTQNTLYRIRKKLKSLAV